MIALLECLALLHAAFRRRRAYARLPSPAAARSPAVVAVVCEGGGGDGGGSGDSGTEPRGRTLRRKEKEELCLSDPIWPKKGRKEKEGTERGALCSVCEKWSLSRRSSQEERKEKLAWSSRPTGRGIRKIVFERPPHLRFAQHSHRVASHRTKSSRD